MLRLLEMGRNGFANDMAHVESLQRRLSMVDVAPYFLSFGYQALSTE